jgi:hypothetical protein
VVSVTDPYGRILDFLDRGRGISLLLTHSQSQSQSQSLSDWRFTARRSRLTTRARCMLICCLGNVIIEPFLTNI